MPGPIDPSFEPDEAFDAFVSGFEHAYEKRIREDALRDPALMAYFFMPYAPDVDAVTIPVTRPPVNEQYRQLLSFSEQEYDVLTKDFRDYLLASQTRWYRQTEPNTPFAFLTLLALPSRAE